MTNHPQETSTNSSSGLVSSWRNHRPGPAQRPCGCGTAHSTGPCTSQQLQAYFSPCTANSFQIAYGCIHVYVYMLSSCLKTFKYQALLNLLSSPTNPFPVLAAVLDLRPPVYGWHGPHGSGQANDHRGVLSILYFCPPPSCVRSSPRPSRPWSPPPLPPPTS